MKRSSGILLPVFSLPSKYGIGSLGKEAKNFIDFLKESGQSYWQVLPEGPVSFGESPYQSYSVHAGNPFFVDLDVLTEEGLLTKEEAKVCLRKYTGTIDYEDLKKNRMETLSLAARRIARDDQSFLEFKDKNRGWLEDYALFMSLKDKHGEIPFTKWPEDIKKRDGHALENAKRELADDIHVHEAVQYFFDRQWSKVREYAHENGIKIIGDLPIYVAPDSSDVWAEPKYFQLDGNMEQTSEAGCPPDAFTDEGQHWGNPLYDWNAMKADGYGWWIRRIDDEAKRYDVLRIDHFRGLESYWSIPKGMKPKDGHWEKGPGMDLLGVLTSWFHGIDFIAEDLGVITDEVRKLREDAKLPGMKVMEFAFDADATSSYLPHWVDDKTVYYTGTHDNAPLALWMEEEDKEKIAFAMEYLGADKKTLPRAMIRAGMQSSAGLFIAQLQDYIESGKGSRINTPGTVGGNWSFILKDGDFNDDPAKEIYRMTRIYGRL